MSRVLAIFLGLALCTASAALAQEPKEEKPNFAEPKKDWKWDEDKRFDFLMERLASLEASLDAVNVAIAKASGKKGAKQGDARRAEAGNSAMDRKGGGPMKWNEFYGTTAEKFFYHPVDPNTTYHTSTVLSQVGTQQEDKAGDSVQGNSGVPLHQRPPQFDYIYLANRNAKERADADMAAIQGKIDALNERREKLEAEQADLWCRLAFRAIQRLNIPRRPELRFRLVAASTAPDDESKAAVLEAAARFLATSLLIIDKAEKEQETALGNIKLIVASARHELDDMLVSENSVSGDSADKDTPLGQFTALAQLLDDTSNNLSESYEVAIEGGQANDAARKDQFRGLLQRSLIEYAQLVMALDESVRTLKKEWGVTVDTKTRAPELIVSWDGNVDESVATLSTKKSQSLSKRNGPARRRGEMPPGQVLALTFTKVSDNEVEDESGSGNDGERANAVMRNDPKRGMVFESDDGGYVAVTDSPQLTPEEFTLMVWVSPREYKLGQVIVDKADWADDSFARGFGLCLGDRDLPSDRVSFTMGNGGWTHVFSSQTIPLGQWTHIACSYDGKKGRVFVNGEVDGVVTPTNTAISPSRFDMRIGKSNFDSRDRTFQGLIDDVLLFGRALSLDEIRSVYEATR
jgi:hypothetical protein